MVVGLMLPDAIPWKLLVESGAVLDVLPPPEVPADVGPDDAVGEPEVTGLFPDDAAVEVAGGDVAAEDGEAGPEDGEAGAEDGDELESPRCGTVVLPDCERDLQ